MSKEKIIIIDGLARSGTTLLASIFHSQNRCACYRGVFHEHLATITNGWPYKQALTKQLDLLLPQDKLVTKKFSIFQGIMSKITHNDANVDVRVLREQTINSINKVRQFDRFDAEEWQQLFDREFKEYSDLDKLYIEIAKKMDLDVLAFRWNQGLPYIKRWLRSDNHYWITVLRNPIDQIASAERAFGWNRFTALKMINNYNEILSNCGFEKRHQLVYFEDLIAEPEYHIQKIFDRLGFKLNHINLNLIQQSGAEYRVETSDLIGTSVDRKDGVKFEGFDKSAVGKYKIAFDLKEKKEILKFISSQYYSRYRDSIGL